MDGPGEQGFLGTALHAPARDTLECLEDRLIVVGPDGDIAALHPIDTAEGSAAARRLDSAGRLTVLAEDRLLLPGFVDLHVHAPQFPQMGKCLDRPLDDWLHFHTFPLEARYADPVFARAVYAALVATLLANGTTTAAYFATIHLPATRILAEICLARGQRALVGRVAMDDPVQCPEEYRDASADEAVAQTRALIDLVRTLPGNEAGLVQAAITPRFIPSCTDALLAALGRLAAETGCAVQTHCSESDWAHRFVLDRCGVSDTAALDGFGLLTGRTLLAHGNFIGTDDRARIHAAGAAIAHCPLSNGYFADAVFPLRRALDAGLKVGLGTDIAGGPSPSLLASARQAVLSSRLLESGVDPALPATERGCPDSRIDAVTAFHLATAGGGRALGQKIGLFRPGYAFDAVSVDLAAPGSDLHVFPGDSLPDRLEKIVQNGSRAAIDRVWVAGRCVHPPVA